MTSRKQKKYLKKLIGKEIIRIGPMIRRNKYIDYSFSAEIVTFLGFSYGQMKIRAEFGEEIELPSQWIDGFWRRKSYIPKAPKTDLNKLKGKKVRMKRAIPIYQGWYRLKEKPVFERRFMKGDWILVCATKYHVILWDCKNHKKVILDSRFTNPKNWYEVK